ncbi:hypothetical protein U9M48_015865 [Paspalum notatum var. saurae]|uniref:Transcription initiation factor TFIID subunit 9 n=1 Tax=Paspalum notatum var. saurae TaxID=547442 RepID=A0AAQ3T518_PASNO
MAAAVRAVRPPSAGAEEPRDARVIRRILRSMGLREGDYDERVVHVFVEFAHRYAGDVLSEARAYAGHAGRASLEADDVRIAIRAKSAFSPGLPRREVMFDLARRRNTIPLHKVTAPPGSIPLPPPEDMMLSQNYLLVRPVMLAPDQQVEETEDDDEGPDPGPNTEREHKGRASMKRKQLPSQGVPGPNTAQEHNVGASMKWKQLPSRGAPLRLNAMATGSLQRRESRLRKMKRADHYGV